MRRSTRSCDRSRSIIPFIGFAASLPAWMFLTGCSSEDPTSAADREAYMESIPIPPGAEPPRFEFPPAVRSPDESLNAFIRRFAEICINGEYDKYRLTVRRRSDPVAKDDFEAVWHNIEEIRILEIIPLPPSESDPPPRYAVVARVRLRRSQPPEKLVVVQILREAGQWVIDALPQAERELLSTASQPATPTTRVSSEAP